MFEYIDRKLLNVWMFFDLLHLEMNPAPNQERERKKQNRRLQRLMKKAYRIPFYRERFEAVGLTPEDFRRAEDLEKFPLLTKQELRVWMDEECEKEKYRFYYLDTTSGSSGTPTKVLYSPREKAWNMANWIRVLMKAGYDPVRGKTVSRLSAHSVSAKQTNLFQRMGYLRREFVDQYAPEKDVIDSINRREPDLLYMNKTELMRIALYSKAHNYPVYHPKFFVPTGEKTDDAARKLFEEVLGPGMIDSFGTAETGACMAKYPGDRVYHIHNDLFVVNLYDDEGHCATEGKLAVTPLYKTDIPLINYVVGDRAVATVETNHGKENIVIKEVQGRMNDFIRHEDGSFTTFFMIAPIFAHCEDVVQLRLIQKSYDLLLIQLVIKTDSSMTAGEIEEELTSKLNEKLNRPMEISFQWMDVIPPDPNGKLRLIVSEVDETKKQPGKSGK